MNRLRNIRQHPAMRRHIVDIRTDHNAEQLGIQHFVHHAGLASTRNDIVGNSRRNPEDKRSLGILFFTLSDRCIDAIVVELYHRLAVHAVALPADTSGEKLEAIHGNFTGQSLNVHHFRHPGDTKDVHNILIHIHQRDASTGAAEVTMRFQDLADTDARDKITATHIEDELIGRKWLKCFLEARDGFGIQATAQCQRCHSING